MSYQLYNIRDFNIFLDVEESEMMKSRTTLSYESLKFQWLENNLTINDIFVDVGSNKGDFTLFAANKCNYVYCIEPHPDNLYWIRQSLIKNKFTNIVVVDGCANSFNGTISLNIGDKSGYHSITRKFSNSITVNSFRLDSIIPYNKYPIVMKIDVEGAELLVLQGCRDILQNIRALLIDVDDGDIEGVKRLLPNHAIIHLYGNEIFLSN